MKLKKWTNWSLSGTPKLIFVVPIFSLRYGYKSSKISKIQTQHLTNFLNFYLKLKKNTLKVQANIKQHFYPRKSDDTLSERSFNQVQQNRPKIELVDIFNYFFDKLPAPVQSTYNITQQTYDSEFSNHVRKSYSKLETLHRGSNSAEPVFRWYLDF